MSLRETYRCFFPVILLISLLNTGIPALAQLPLLDREINLSCNTAEISRLLKEIGHKGKFSFTYTSQLQTHRMASVLHRKQTVRNHLATSSGTTVFKYWSKIIKYY